MATAKLICDASHNSVIDLGGYAGGIVIEEDGYESSYLYHGVAADSPDPSESEMQAIGAGLKKISEIIRDQQIKITDVEIYSDSMASQHHYKRYKQDRTHHPKYTKALAFIDAGINRLGLGKGKITINHVKAHVDDLVASPMERLHNVVDKSAVSARFRAQKHIHKPFTENSRHYGIVVERDCTEEQAQDLYKIGEMYADKGFIARVAFVGQSDTPDSEHPLMKGIAKSASLRGLKPSGFFDVQTGMVGGGLVNGCSGMDMALVRRVWKDGGRHPKEANVFIDKDYHAGIANRVIYGPQYSGKFNQTHLTGRTEEASKFIFNLTNPESQSKLRSADGWLNVFAPYVDVPYYKSVKSVLDLNMAPAQEVSFLPLSDEQIIDIISECIEQYHGEVESSQLANLLQKSLVDTVGFCGDEATSAIKSAIYCESKGMGRVIRDAKNTIPAALHQDSLDQQNKAIPDREYQTLNKTLRSTLSLK